MLPAQTPGGRNKSLHTLGIHRANMHRYWFEDAGSSLDEQMAFLRCVKRLTRAEIETFTEGLSIPDSVADFNFSVSHDQKRIVIVRVAAEDTDVGAMTLRHDTAG